MRLNKELTKKFNKINKIISLDKLLHSDMYYFDNGQVEKMVDINKENVKYTVIKVNTDTSTKDYLVFAIIHINDKSTTHQLLKSFDTKTKTNEYFKSLCTYIKNNSNDDIINKCYEDLSFFPRKNLITKLFGI